MLDSIVARTVHAARLLELACHESEGWTIALGPAVLPAGRVLSSSSIDLRATFAPQCWIATPYVTAELRHDGVVRSVRQVKVPDDEMEFSVSWRFVVSEPHVVSIHG